LHSRNRHTGRYDFGQLTKSCPELAPFVSKNRFGDLSIDFAQPEAVKALNRALLKQFYGISKWDIPAGYLCPPIPGRSDYIHTLADLLASGNADKIPRGDQILGLDIGVGANAIYPIVGYCEYGWRFVGTETDPVAMKSAEWILTSNPELEGACELREQKSKNIIDQDEFFDFTVCNPPFHASLAEANAGSQRKWKNLGKAPESKKGAPKLNFGGQGAELWAPGGEIAFVQGMISESREIPKRILWFTTLLSKESNLLTVYHALNQAKVFETRTLDLFQGQKKSRIVAWTFLNTKQQADWARDRWPS
jgi:23S rRNA (adenine1618-N6)-methyltransferase